MIWVILTVIDVFKDVPCVRVSSVHHTEEDALNACTRPEHRIVKVNLWN